MVEKNSTRYKVYMVIIGLVLIGVSLGIGFLLDLFWGFANKGASTMYWVTKGTVYFVMLVSIVATAFFKRDKGTGPIFMFLTIGLLFIPLVARLILMIPGIAGIVIVGILDFILLTLYIIFAIAMDSYNGDIDTKRLPELEKYNTTNKQYEETVVEPKKVVEVKKVVATKTNNDKE